jgi:hypothetical protein
MPREAAATWYMPDAALWRVGADLHQASSRAVNMVRLYKAAAHPQI